MSNKTGNKNVATEDDVMSQEAFNELIDNLEVVATLTMYGRKSIKHYVKEMQAELERKDKRIKELEEELAEFNKQLDLDYVDENFIPKQAVIDKIKEIKYLQSRTITSEAYNIAQGEIIVLQELLEGEK